MYPLCQTCGASRERLVIPFGGSTTHVCEDCMNAIHERIEKENWAYKRPENYNYAGLAQKMPSLEEDIITLLAIQGRLMERLKSELGNRAYSLETLKCQVCNQDYCNCKKQI